MVVAPAGVADVEVAAATMVEVRSGVGAAAAMVEVRSGVGAAAAAAAMAEVEEGVDGGVSNASCPSVTGSLTF
eukprot:5722445-Pleurochrysis_carterae.AAC.1